MKRLWPALVLLLVAACGPCGPPPPITQADVPRLLAQLRQDGDPSKRAFAAVLLGQAGHDAQEAVPALMDALNERDADVRWAAAEALVKVAPRAKARVAVPVLREELRRASDEYRRTAACNALAKLGGEAKEAVPDLRQALNDREGMVSEAAARVLRAIDSKAAANPGLK